MLRRSSERRRPIKPLQTKSSINHELTKLEDRLHGQHYYVEFEIKYLGVVPGFTLETDTTNRTEVLKIIDRGKKQGLIPLQYDIDSDAILCLSTEVVRITRRDPPEEKIKELELHMISRVCYVTEEGQHILAVTHGTPEVLNMTVLLCECQEQAEAISSIWGYCFHLVYTDAMVELIEETIDLAISTDHSRISDPNTESETGSEAPHPLSDISNTSTQAELLREYMHLLKTKLKVEELVQFSKQWKNWNYSTNKLLEFCDSLYKLFGPERTYLLTKLFPFIPERDCSIYENFLARHDIRLPGPGTASSMQGFPTFYTRSISDVSINSNTAISNDPEFDINARDFDTDLDAIGRKFERIEHSVGETTHSYFPSVSERNSKV